MIAQPKPIGPNAIEDADLEAEIQDGVAAADAGRVTSWSQIREWMTSWGSPNEMSPPGQPSQSPQPR